MTNELSGLLHGTAVSSPRNMCDLAQSILPPDGAGYTLPLFATTIPLLTNSSFKTFVEPNFKIYTLLEYLHINCNI